MRLNGLNFVPALFYKTCVFKVEEFWFSDDMGQEI